MSYADRATITSGVPGTTLMHRAGVAVADAIGRRWRRCPVLVLCGPGNNGGDGFVVAQTLQSRGWPVKLGLLGERSALKGDAAQAAQRWAGEFHPISLSLLDGTGLVVDAAFGAGLAREFDGVAAEVLLEASRQGVAVCAVDMPSGVDGETGAVRGTAVPAALTVTFFRKKPGHLLLPGRQLCGDLEVADIGIPAWVLEEIAPATYENAPKLWLDSLVWPGPDTHKYRRGHALINGGLIMTGAARLAAMSAARSGAGLVTIAVPAPAWPVYAASMLSVMVEALPTDELEPALHDARRNVILIGPGAGVNGNTRRNVLAAAATRRALVLDADALTAFSSHRDTLFQALHDHCVLTPHEGEFARLFDMAGSKLQRARAAALQSGAVIVLKGSDTVIAAPDGKAVINAHTSPWLATGGTGDVLAGMITGLLAQGVPPYQAACAAVWMHGEAARMVGPGLLAEDLPNKLPQVLRQLIPC